MSSVGFKGNTRAKNYLGLFAVAILVAGLTAAIPKVAGPFYLAAIPAGVIAACLIRLRNQQQPFTSLFPTTLSSTSTADATEPIHSRAWWQEIITDLSGSLFPNSRTSTPVVAQPPEPPPENFDPRPYRFQLRWDKEFGTYFKPTRSRGDNKEFRQRVCNELKHYVDYGFDTLALCDVVSKSSAFTEGERAEVIEDILETY